jgi:HEAT repeat protein
VHAMTVLVALITSVTTPGVNRGARPAIHTGLVDRSTPSAPSTARTIDTVGERGAPPPWASDDPADSLYRAAREALADGDYRRAAALFHQIGVTYPKSTYVGSAAYYEAFALYRSGETDDLRDALTVLRRLTGTDVATAARTDAATLHTRICTALARQGDESCAARIVTQADSALAPCASGDENDVRIAALNALLQMDSERALPILQKVLSRRDACSVELRRKALFLVSQKDAPASTDMLMASARQDPDPGVREQAVFWLSQVKDPRVVGMLDSIATHDGDEEVRQKALFSLSQQDDPKALAALRAFAERDGAPEDLREKAIFWIGQNDADSSTAYLKQLFTRVSSDDLRKKILFSIAQHGGSSEWLLSVANDAHETESMREQAIFWAAQSGLSTGRLVSLLNTVSETPLREKLVFTLSQRDDSAAVDALMHVAKTDHDPEIRKKAVFWLGQSKDPRAAQFLQELINQ